MFKVTIPLLKQKHGEHDDRWWWDGVSTKVREECLKLQNEDQGAKAKEQYIYLIDYHAIASNDWELFSRIIIHFQRMVEKAKQLEWLIKLNKVRQTTHHEEKWPATKEQVNFVREYHSKVMERFKLPEENKTRKVICLSAFKLLKSSLPCKATTQAVVIK